MKYLDHLTSGEIQLVCTSIPHAEIIKYFKKNPKEFSKIRPGFRPAAVTPKDAIRILVNNINCDFISSFVEKIVEMWLIQIQEAYENYVNQQKNETSALVHTLSQSFFSENVTAYFKLSDHDYSREQIALISDLVCDYKATKQQIEDLNEVVQKLETVVRDMESLSKKKNSEIKNLQNKLRQTLEELENLRKLENELQVLSLDINIYKEKAKTLENQKEQQRQRIEQLSLQINQIAREKEALESEIVQRIEIERKTKMISKEREFYLLRPSDLTEFQDNLSYVFEDLGMLGSVPGVSLLKKHLTNILFCGVPIIINEQSGITLAKCVANALIGTQEISLFRYNQNVTQEDIFDFLSKSKRVVLLENFIGNYNETLLLPVLRMYGDKIVFLTTSYERSLNYISSEFLNYCSYINLGHFNQLTNQVKINEDPLTVTEEKYFLETPNKQGRHLKVLNRILTELSLEYLLTSIQLHGVLSDDDISAELIYSILPYCIYVCQKQPMCLSESLQKFASRCTYKELIGDWFVNE